MIPKISKIILVLLLILLVFSVFKNIQYPIIWGDEADTVMYAERILDYGYPKVHDGVNSLNYDMISGKVGVNEEYDVWTVTMWGQYYFTSVGARLARNVEDIYTKTLLLRIPHGIVGLIGILTIPFIVTPSIKSKDKKVYLWISYVFLTLFSVSLILHIQEVRSYALSIFFASMFLNIFVRYKFYKSIGSVVYYVFGFIILFLFANTFPPGYMSLIASIGVYVLISNFYYVKRNKKVFDWSKLIIDTTKDVLPIALSGVAMLPILRFFETSKVSQRAYIDMKFGWYIYSLYVTRVINFMFKYHFLGLFVFLIIALFAFEIVSKKISFKKSFLNIVQKEKVFTFLTFIFVLYIPVVAITPYMFDRYFVFLQPLLSLMISFGLILVFERIRKITPAGKRANSTQIFSYALVLVFAVGLILNIEIYKGRIYELSNKYIGPMDYIVNYVQENFQDTQSLVIDTNIEQPVLMYYLGSQVICDDSPDCFSEPSDIIIPRRGFLQDNFVQRVEGHMGRAEYEEVKLPILDYPANNIPELSLGLRHLFVTPVTENDSEKVILYVKKEE